ncbi:MAG: hypothetical protein HY287_15040 [Planctomycetes bacterium]|nr:hypothetical protein [Planctomycetota bacterium]
MIEVIGWIVLGAMFVIVSVVSVTALRHHSTLGDGSSVVVGICVGALCACALHQGFAASAPPVVPTGPRGGFGWILIPYIALALTVLAVLLAMFLFCAWKWVSRVVRNLQAWITGPSSRAFPGNRSNERRHGQPQESNRSLHTKTAKSQSLRNRRMHGSEWRER